MAETAELGNTLFSLLLFELTEKMLIFANETGRKCINTQPQKQLITDNFKAKLAYEKTAK